jgi:hypothetical protein
LENIISGREREVEFKRHNITWEDILEHLNNIVLMWYPGLIPKGSFVNKDADYLVYELQWDQNCSVKLLDFGNMFRVIRC